MANHGIIKMSAFSKAFTDFLVKTLVTFENLTHIISAKIFNISACVQDDSDSGILLHYDLHTDWCAHSGENLGRRISHRALDHEAPEIPRRWVVRQTQAPEEKCLSQKYLEILR